jgi:tRNA pseudouridine55 synthase
MVKKTMTNMTQNKIERRIVNGVLLLNKDCGISSNHALQRVKRLFNAKKAGHTGSLDPLASGVLPICFGAATKFSHILLEADKTYAVTARLGIKTTTSDAEGEIIETKSVPNFSAEDIQKVVAEFMGAGKQVPSMFSALKHNGQPLYKLARQGITVERPPRDIFIYQFDLIEQGEDTLRFIIKCSKGTYIRNLIEDLGEKLGCGAHVSQLERTQAGKFNLENCYTLEQLQACLDLDAWLLPTNALCV